ncbi:TetR/AcrR family transcriptional regulator [Lichenibacterium ramalinae]|uniref:TetR/AcrR family transcriptional regulator n=1 Tax=Lichenibacterium ramalinae TaxID=2316527 RepID=A0A4Q2RHS8_9HYPH|nr:TetR/AcrR family transcriptional regulator [Lichenibacterium ramalinae]RYB05668.1 TetR/AcrR family transcriptional regulator [Lichenibacterium ramalinae]
MPSSRTSNRYQGLPLEQRRAQRREALIRAAIAVYGERGFRAATVKAVCDAAGLTERYFYESFLNSEALLVASYETVIAAMLGEMRAAAEAAPSTARAEAVLRSYYAMLRRDPKGARVFLVEIAGVSPAVDHVSGAALKGFGLLLDMAVNPDGAAPTSPGLLRAGVMGGIIHIALRWIAGGYAEDIDAVVAQASRLCGTLRQGA